MLNKNPVVASASADAKAKRAGLVDVNNQPKHAQQTAPIHEPRADWVPLASAPFHYNSYGYIRSADKWGENLGLKVKQFVTSIWLRDDGSTPEYTFRFKNNWEAWIEAEGLCTWLSATAAYVVTLCSDIEVPSVGGDPDEYLSRVDWKEFPPQQKVPAQLHRSLVKAVLSSLRRDFGSALSSGSARIVARKNTVLAPFEQVSWDQWQYFKLDEPEPGAPTWEHQQYDWAEPASPPVRWFDLRNCGWGTQWRRPTTATGPNGEKLYAIHVAPGAGRTESRERNLEEQCTRWLVDSMMAFPERSPKPRAVLVEEAVAMFPGLTKRGFQRCFTIAQRETRNFKWSLAGAPPKSRR